MKKSLALLLSLLMVLTFVGCAATPAPATQAPATQAPATEAPAATPAPTPVPVPAYEGVINVQAFTTEVPNMLNRYLALHPEMKITINATVTSTTNNAYEPVLDQALAAGNSVDMYCAESAFVLKYTQGDMASYALPYEDLGIKVSDELAAAKIAQYTVDIGTRPSDSKLVGLGYQATGGALIYRRSLAKDTWGTDDPATIQDKVGPGWDKFFAAAADLKAKGYGIVSGDGDIWHAIENSSDKGWIVDGKLYIDPKREAFLDLSKKLKDGGFHNDTQDWQAAWFSDMAGTGAQPIFSFFGPAWLINYVMASHSGAEYDKDGKFVKAGGTYGDWAVCKPPIGFFWGGTWVIASKDLAGDANASKRAAVATMIDWITLDCTKTGLQYGWANGSWDSAPSTKDSVASGTVMAMSDGKIDFLGGQNMFDAFVPANEFANGKNLTQYDATINTIWRAQVRLYTAGTITRDKAIADFKQQVKDQLGIDAA